MAGRRALAAGPQAAVVLHSYDWSESSLVLDLWTESEGRLAVVAKGAKRPYSQLRAVLLPFQRVAVQLGKPKAEASDDDVRTLKTAEWMPGAIVMPAERLLSAYYCNELLMKMVPRGQAIPALFRAYCETLEALAPPRGAPLEEGDTGIAETTALRAFELALLSQLGLLPDLAQETLSGAVLLPDRSYVVRPEFGLVPVRSDEPGIQGTGWVAMQAALLDGRLKALQWAVAPHGVALGAMMRPLLQHHLGGAPLRTRETVMALRRLMGTRSTVR